MAKIDDENLCLEENSVMVVASGEDHCKNRDQAAISIRVSRVRSCLRI
jgi:hypothetical protein